MTEADGFSGGGINPAAGSNERIRLPPGITPSSGIAMGGLVGLAEQSAMASSSAPSITQTADGPSNIANNGSNVFRKRSLAPAPLYPAMGPKLPIIGNHPHHHTMSQQHHQYLHREDGEDEDDFGIGPDDRYPKKGNHSIANNGNDGLMYGMENVEDPALTADDSDEDYEGTGGSRTNSIFDGHHNGNMNIPQGSRAGRRKIKIEFIDDKSRRHITFSKRKAGIMKKVLLLVASETGHVYTFATPKLQPLITKPEGKNLIQACLNAPEPGDLMSGASPSMTNTGPVHLAVSSSGNSGIPSSMSSSAHQSRPNSVSQLDAHVGATANTTILPHSHPIGPSPPNNNNGVNVNNYNHHSPSYLAMPNSLYPNNSNNNNSGPHNLYNLNPQMGPPPVMYAPQNHHSNHNYSPNTHHNQAHALPYIDPYGELTSNHGSHNNGMGYGSTNNSNFSGGGSGAPHWPPPTLDEEEAEENDDVDDEGAVDGLSSSGTNP